MQLQVHTWRATLLIIHKNVKKWAKTAIFSLKISFRP